MSDLFDSPSEENSKCLLNAHECFNLIESQIAFEVVSKRCEQRGGHLVKK